MATRSARRRARGDEDGRPGDGAGRSLPHALGLTLASALVWGVAHIRTGRQVSGGILLAGFAVVVLATATAVTMGTDLLGLAVRPGWLAAAAAGILLVGLVWVTVVIRSYQIVRPERLAAAPRTAGAVAVAALCFVVAVPVSWGAYYTYVSQDTLNSIFKTGGPDGRTIDTDDPWNGRDRVNVLLLGGDAAENRTGVRTDSMTVASVDTETGDTVLLSLPRNLESFPMPPGPPRQRFPYGFTGVGPYTPGLLNEVFQYAEDNPAMVPGAVKGERGPKLLKETIGGILGLRVDYYILVDMFGFADIIDAMGGVKLTIPQPIPYGQRGDVLQPGTRVLNGKEALWYGRSRTLSDDYTRMGRQKCLLGAIAKQADLRTVLLKFDQLAAATRRAIATDIPQELLPALVDLSKKIKDGAGIESLPFVPPLIHPGSPDFDLIRKLTGEATGDAPPASSSPSASPPGSAPAAAPPTGSSSPTPGAGPTSTQTPSDPVALDAACP